MPRTLIGQDGCSRTFKVTDDQGAVVGWDVEPVAATAARPGATSAPVVAPWETAVGTVTATLDGLAARVDQVAAVQPLKGTPGRDGTNGRDGTKGDPGPPGPKITLSDASVQNLAALRAARPTTLGPLSIGPSGQMLWLALDVLGDIAAKASAA